MAELLYFTPAKRKAEENAIDEICIDIHADNIPTSIKKMHHKSGNIHIRIMTTTINLGLAALNEFLEGSAANIKEIYLES